MAHQLREPAAPFNTHAVANQPPPLEGRNLFDDHVALAGRRLAWALLAEPVDPAVEAERLIFRRAYRDIFTAILEDGVSAGELPAQDCELSATALVGAIGEALVGPTSPTAAHDAPPLASELSAFCLRAVGATEAAHAR